MDTSLEYYLGINPASLSDKEWARKIALLTEIRKREGMEGG
jgi:hypothetical protein